MIQYGLDLLRCNIRHKVLLLLCVGVARESELRRLERLLPGLHMMLLFLLLHVLSELLLRVALEGIPSWRE